MIITIRGDSIDITEIPLHQYIDWESLLNELNAEHIPGWYQDGKRMGVSIADGKAHVFIYRTVNMPSEAEILKILGSYGIA
jgi:hypothetical protein